MTSCRSNDKRFDRGTISDNVTEVASVGLNALFIDARHYGNINDFELCSMPNGHVTK
jgi:hypothetical protein